METTLVRILRIGGHLISSKMLFASILVLLPALTHAQCAQWDVAGQWNITQGKFVIPVQLNQNGKVITGTAKHEASYNPENKTFGTYRTVEGSIDGTVEGTSFNVQIYWPDGLVGVYRGTIGPQGRIEGDTYDKNKPSSRANWYSTRVMTCRNTPPIKPSIILNTNKSPTPGGPKPAVRVIKSTGRTTTQGGTSPGAPSIIAFNKPGQAPGTRTLTWDGGPEHPYAEVWVKVDDQDETFVVEQGKGTRQVMVEAGKTYLYILTDAGTTLATTTIGAK